MLYTYTIYTILVRANWSIYQAKLKLQFKLIDQRAIPSYKRMTCSISFQGFPIEIE